MGSVNKIIIVGDYANGIDSGVIRSILIGNQIKMDYVKRLSYKIEKEIKRKIQFTSLDSYHGSGLVLYQV